MAQRLKVLISAYACEPGKGSEPEVGWQWAIQLARYHDVTVLTRANNEPLIRAGLAEVPPDLRPRFVFHDLSPLALRLKKTFKAHQTYYRRWQRSAHEVIAKLLRGEIFDLVHHLTYAGFRVEPAIFGHGLPTIWGPVGGIESPPSCLLPWGRPNALLPELARNFNNAWQSHSGTLARRARRASCVIASTREMHRELARGGVDARLLPTIGLHSCDVPARVAHPANPLRLLYTGNLIFLKGLDLAIEALAASGTDATLSIIGDGPFRPVLERLCAQLGLGERVRFLGRSPRSEVLAAYSEYDAFIFPSLHDTGGFALIEAMAAGLAPIVLALSGPAVAVTPECGFIIPPTSRAAAVRGLAEGIARLSREPETLERMGQAARARVLKDYDWEAKGAQMAEIYAQVIGSARK